MPWPTGHQSLSQEHAYLSVLAHLTLELFLQLLHPALSAIGPLIRGDQLTF